MSETEYYLTTGEHPRKEGKMLAVVSKGSPQLGDTDIFVCDIKEVSSQEEAQEWFKEVLVTKPWETRQ